MIIRNKWVLIGAFGLIMMISLVCLYEKIHQPPDPILDNLNTKELPKAKTSGTKSPSPIAVDNQKRDAVEPVIMVDIKGQVQHPGVYQLPKDKRVLDAIEKAGGFKDQAEQNSINLAQKLADEMVIYVPKKGEKSVPEAASSISSSTNSSSSASPPTVHINSATLDQLQELTGVGPSKAEAILKYREEHGPFKNTEDLKNVTGIGDKSLEKMKDQIDLN